MYRLLPLLLLACAFPVLAQDGEEPEPPDFDRPGLGFAASTLPRGAFAVELGLPSLERGRDAEGVRSTQYSGDIELRLGLGQRLELQAFSTPWNTLHERPRGGPTTKTHGAGDSGIALKVALPTASDDHAWALLASSSFATGSGDFSEGGTQYALGSSYEYSFNARLTGALYASATRGAGEDSLTWAPSLSVTLTDTLSTYVEAGFTRTHGAPSTAVAGTGLLWRLRPGLQFDASVDVGLDADSPDLQAGLGVSLYFE